MKNISVSLTKDQVRNRSKTVTRRIGWENLKAGELLQTIEKGQGLKRGEKVVKLSIVRVVSVRRERLDAILGHPEECAKEGFPNISPEAFIVLFCVHNHCEPDQIITRIEFAYVDARTMAAPQLRTIYWISVDDHRPDDEITVLVQDTDGEIFLGHHLGSAWFGEHGCEVYPTHWADLPEPARVA